MPAPAPKIIQILSYVQWAKGSQPGAVSPCIIGLADNGKLYRLSLNAPDQGWAVFASEVLP